MASCSTSFDSDTGWQTLLKELQKKATGHVNENNDEPILGVRVVYCNNSSSNPSNSDHSDLHNEHWKKALTDSLSDRPRSLEVGTVTGFDFKEGVVSVLWDCGNTRTYTYDLWKNLTVYSLGPAGNLVIVNYIMQCNFTSIYTKLCELCVHDIISSYSEAIYFLFNYSFAVNNLHYRSTSIVLTYLLV